MYQIIIKCSFAILFTCTFGLVKSQTDSLKLTGDSLSLQQAIQTVMANYPSIKQAETGIKIADSKIGLAKTGFYPDIDITGSYTRIGPVPVIDFPPIGEFQLAPKDNFNAAINYRQTIWDFGKTSKEISYENQNKEITKQSIEQIKQKLTLVVIGNYYSLVYLQEAVNIKDEQIKNLTAHLEFIQKKKNTGSATEYDLLSTQVKLSNAESQKTDLETAKNIQATNLNSLLGISPSTHIMVKRDLNIVTPSLLLDSMINKAFTDRDEIKIANEKVGLADLRYQSINAQTNPVISLFASAGYKNGYVPDLNALKANFAIGLGVKIPLFYGNRKKYNLQQALEFKQSNQYDIELSKRSISNEVMENNSQVLSSQKKINQFEKQLALASKALSIAEVNYKEGAITNLELLDATTNLSESKLALLKAQIEYLVNVYKLKLAMGERVE
jgi:outer membrane protein